MKFLLVFLLILALIVIDRVLLWYESRGWIYYCKVKPGGSGGAILSVSEFLHPGAKEIVIDQESKENAGQIVENSRD